MRLKMIDLSLKNVATSHPVPLQLIDLDSTRNQEMYVNTQNKPLQGNGAVCRVIAI